MILDIENSPSVEEITTVLRYQELRIQHWKKRTLFSSIVLLLLIGTTSLFLAGMPLHFLWEHIGKYFLLITYGALLWVLHSALLLCGAFSQHRDFTKTYSTKEN